MDLKKKFNQLRWNIPKPHFLNSNMGLSPEEETEVFPDAVVQYAPAAAKVVKNRKLPLGNPHREQEVLASIEPCFYSQNNFDPSSFELNNLPQVLDIGDINEKRKKIKEQLSVVSKKISDLILENHPSYAAELQKVTELQKLLLQAYDVCYRARSNLQESQEETTTVGLRILAYYRKINLYSNILSGLKTIKTLHETDFRLRELLEEGNYSGAIQLCLECQKAAEIYKHYSCISELTCKLQDTLVGMEEQLNRALASIALNFDVDRYQRLQAAYSLLKKEDVSADILLSHFESAVLNSPLSVLSDYFQECCSFEVGNGDSYKLLEICKNIPVGKFLGCFTEVCRLLWKILHNYHCVLVYHMNEEQVLQTQVTENDYGRNGNEILRKFQDGLKFIWNSAVSVVDALLGSADLNILKFDNFLEVVRLTNKFIEIGKRNFLSLSDTLRETINRQTVSYFKCYHRARMEELKVFLESEAWEICPVSKTFRIHDLPEFMFHKYDMRNGEVNVSKTEDLEKLNSENLPFEIMDINEDNPFVNLGYCPDPTTTAVLTPDIVDSDDSDVADELKQDFIEEGIIPKQEKRHSGFKTVDKLPPILCSTALNVLRLFGRYLHMVTMLKSIAFEVISSLAQLYYYYFYSIWMFFGCDAVDFNLVLTAPKLQSALKLIEQTLIDLPGLVSRADRIPSARMSPVIRLNQADNLFGLSCRVVGVESLIYVSKQTQLLQDYLTSMIPKEKRTFIQHFSQTLVLSSAVRRPVYGAVATRCLNFSHLLNRINGVNWDISELMSQHSSYVDFLLQELQNFKVNLKKIAKTTPFPKEGHDIVWDVCIRCINRVLVEGYANARKCTNEGRALMQLDYQQLIRELEAVTELKPIPDKSFVDTYIKAYYLPESAIDSWISEHKEYSVRQVINLLNVATHISKRTRQRIFASLEESGASLP